MNRWNNFFEAVAVYSVVYLLIGLFAARLSCQWRHMFDWGWVACYYVIKGLFIARMRW